MNTLKIDEYTVHRKRIKPDRDNHAQLSILACVEHNPTETVTWVRFPILKTDAAREKMIDDIAIDTVKNQEKETAK